MSKHSFLIAGTGSGSGKTTVTLGIIAALKNRGLSISPFKCGPDYIDTGFHSMAADTPAHNLDRWMMGEEGLRASYERWSQNKDVSIVEGVMGLYDGLSIEDDFGSSADIADILDIPVVLVINARGMARSVAAMVKGYCIFSDKINIVGIIANNVGSQYHAEMLKTVLEKENLPTLIGWLKRDNKLSLPERHLGLVPAIELQENKVLIDYCSKSVKETINLDLLLERTNLLSANNRKVEKKNSQKANSKFVVAIAKDEAFSFYYDDNLFLLKEAGATLVDFSPLHDENIPRDTDLVYIGGGFPEVFADKLSLNNAMKDALKSFAENGGAIYAECGGMMYLGDSIITKDEQHFKMCSVLPIISKMNEDLKRLGYREVTILKESFLGEEGAVFRGHEFHYSEVIEVEPMENVFQAMHPIKGEVETKGYSYKNVIASYCHLHFELNTNFGYNLFSRLKKAE